MSAVAKATIIIMLPIQTAVDRVLGLFRGKSAMASLQTKINDQISGARRGEGVLMEF
jgi:hypothetical protein